MRGMNLDQQVMMGPQNMMVIDDFQANKSESQYGHQQTGENTRRGFKTSQRQSKRAKSGPTNSEAARYKLIHQQAEVPDYFNNEDQNSFNTLFNNGQRQQVSKSSLAHQSFPNLSYVHAKYYNQDKQQFQDNQELGYHHQLYSQPRHNVPSDFMKGGLISPVPMTTGTYGTKRSEHRMIGMFSEAVPKGNMNS